VCRHISQFQSTSVPETASFLRILTTKTVNVTKCEIKVLEQPNIVFGVGAGGWYLLYALYGCVRADAISAENL